MVRILSVARINNQASLLILGKRNEGLLLLPQMPEQRGSVQTLVGSYRTTNPASDNRIMSPTRLRRPMDAPLVTGTSQQLKTEQR
jgi:hypothetical protein